MSLCGIYQITQRDTDKVYIGSSISISKRWSGHLSSLATGNHSNRKLQSDVDKYGIATLVFEILELLPVDDNILFEREVYWLNQNREKGRESYNPAYPRPKQGTGKIAKCKICGKPHYARDFCEDHWKKETAKGKKCTICGKQAVCMDLCSRHYQQDLKERKSKLPKGINLLVRRDLAAYGEAGTLKPHK